MRGQQGLALPFVLAFMALTIPIVTSTLYYTSTLSKDSVVKADIAFGQYGSLGGYEHGRYRLLYEPGFDISLITNQPFVYQVPLGGRSIDVEAVRITDPLGSPPPSIAALSKDLRTSKIVDLATAGPDTEVTYTITVQNQGADEALLQSILDGLPAEFSYVAFSTSGVTFDEPAITPKSDPDNEGIADLLEWVLSPSITLQPAETATLVFRAITSSAIPDGNYCNNAWIEPGGKARTGSGATAKVTVGTPPNTLCPGEVGEITKAVVRTDTGGGRLHRPL